MPPELHTDPAAFDFHHVVADADEIQQFNPQRFEMMQLDAVIHLDTTAHLIIGYKDVRPDEFWVRGHMPGYPLMPGVLICEAAAQLCSFYCMKLGVLQGDFIGFGGMDNVRFRSPVKPGDRLVLVGKGIKLHRRQMIFSVQGFVQDRMVFHGDIIGMSLSRKQEA